MRLSPFLSDVMECCRDQAWKVTVHEAGRWILRPPPGRTRPGYESVVVYDPGHDSHSQKVVFGRLIRAGLKLWTEEETKPMEPYRPKLTTRPPDAPAVLTQHPGAPAASSVVAQARAKISEAINILSDLETLLGRLERDADSLAKLREALKSLGG